MIHTQLSRELKKCRFNKRKGRRLQKIMISFIKPIRSPILSPQETKKLGLGDFPFASLFTMIANRKDLER
ncbi:hypothetical protein MWN52_13610 [Pseudoxanthomonas winnipegensis]|uniref:hypothetical protein n=1 Tax=Pseudoxanthomonas winnipegensis TaxID=2480810 RepID=UPI0025763F85|nr:hypothetical protein [Pseudoxanthomonas winnipegensis]WJI14657.1 hypothetical protein MWN52_13610 [Pseudoxanthomonas winnipegensis]